MTFKEKIDNILRISKKKFNSISDLETAAGLGMNTLRKAYNDNREPSPKVLVKLLEEIGINEDWWDTGQGAILVEKPTPVSKNTESETLKELMEVYKQMAVERLEKINELKQELEDIRSGKKK